MYLRLGNHQASNFLGLETTKSGHLSSRIENDDGDRDTLFSFSSEAKLLVNDFSDGDIGKPSLLSAAMFTFSLCVHTRACQRVTIRLCMNLRDGHKIVIVNDTLSNTNNRYNYAKDLQRIFITAN